MKFQFSLASEYEMANSRPSFTFTAQIEVEMQRQSHVIELFQGVY